MQTDEDLEPDAINDAPRSADDKAVSGPWWMHAASVLGFDLELKPQLASLARRLAYSIMGLVFIGLLSCAAPAWLALVALAIWFLPFAIHAAVRDLALLAFTMVLTVASSRTQWKLLASLVVFQIETVAFIGVAALAAAALM
ncbi:hypothetical protein [Anatilimnocola floriformis]|uniref:hypothetical protein n=1 Tax=Anatilimnocola floriformis TaxID=2948575 RepID=UPI0020C203AC|nr:hypothetical protein [Anatilimnocola floriformis]